MSFNSGFLVCNMIFSILQNLYIFSLHLLLLCSVFFWRKNKLTKIGPKSNEYFMILFEKPSILYHHCSLQVVESWVNMVDPTMPQCAPRPYPVWLRLFRVRVQGNPKISTPQKTLFLQWQKFWNGMLALSIWMKSCPCGKNILCL